MKFDLSLIFLCVCVVVLFEKQAKSACTLLRHMGEWRYSSTHFLTLALDEGEWLYSSTLRSDPGNENLCPINMSLPGPQNFIKRGKFISPYLQSNYDSSVLKPVV